jgi:hypothetical protein
MQTQFSERKQSSVGPFQDAGWTGGWDRKVCCSGEHVHRDVAASVTLLFGAVGMALSQLSIVERRTVAVEALERSGLSPENFWYNSLNFLPKSSSTELVEDVVPGQDVSQLGL